MFPNEPDDKALEAMLAYVRTRHDELRMRLGAYRTEARFRCRHHT